MRAAFWLSRSRRGFRLQTPHRGRFRFAALCERDASDATSTCSGYRDDIAMTETPRNDATPSLESFDVVMLDLNGTFMFGQDRFGPEQDYAATYSRLGGIALAPALVQALISETVHRMDLLYRDPACRDRFPAVRDVIGDVAASQPVSQDD